MPLYEWDEALCRAYADGLRPVVRFDHAPWAARMAKRLGEVPPGATVLDVATGPGFLLVELGKRLPGARLVGTDQAVPMLAIARREAERAGLSIETVCCPAEALALPDASADVVTCNGPSIAQDFWRSFRAGISGDRAREAMARAGFGSVELRRVGFDYLLVGRRAS